jgi:hypothetical protein
LPSCTPPYYWIRIRFNISEVWHYDDDGAAGVRGRGKERRGLAAAAINAALAAAASPTGLFKTLSNVNRFRAEIGRVWRMSTVSSRHSSLFPSCVNIFVLRSRRFPVRLCITNRGTVTVAVLLMAPTFVTIPVNAMAPPIVIDFEVNEGEDF